jgi:hypothetical protein
MENELLDKPVNGCIVAFVDMGLWNGRPKGGRVYADKVNSIFDVMMDYSRFFMDSFNVRSSLTHHDGTHYCLYRVAESREAAERLCGKIAHGGMTEKQFRKATKSLRPYIAEIYGC